MLLLLLTFLIGVVVDALVAKYTIAASRYEQVKSAVCSTLLSFLNIVVLSIILILPKDDVETSILRLLMYLGGNFLGTYYGTKRPKKLQKIF